MQHRLPYKHAISAENKQISNVPPSVFLRRGRKRGEGLVGAHAWLSVTLPSLHPAPARSFDSAVTVSLLI